MKKAALIFLAFSVKWGSHNFKMETILMDTLVIAQCGGWLRSYLRCWPPAEEPQRTKWPTAKIWLYKWVVFLVLNSTFMLLAFFFGKCMKSSFRKTTPLQATVLFKTHLQPIYTLTHLVLFNKTCSGCCTVTIWICEDFLMYCWRGITFIMCHFYLETKRVV